MTEPKISTKENLKEAFAQLREVNPLLEITDRTINGSVYKVFKNAPKTMRELFTVIELLHGDFPFIVEGKNELTFAETIQKAKNICTYLNKLGIKPGDKVGICMQNCTEWVVIYVALAAYGATVVPFNSWWKKEELSYGVEHSEVKLVFSDTKRYESLKDLNIEIIVNEPIDNKQTFNEIVSGTSTEWPEANATEEDISVLLYTSGSTGLPKGVMLTHLAIINALFSFYTLGELRKIVHNETLLDVENASVLINVPLFHVTGLVTQFLLSMIAKRKLIIMYKWEAKYALDLIKEHKVTNLSGVPTQSWDLLNHPDIDNYDLSSLIDIGAGGAARPEDQVFNLHDKFNIPMTFAWGMTETAALGTILRGDDYLKRPNSAGLVVPDISEIAVMDDSNNFLNTDEIGEIVFKSPSNTIGYLKNEEETKNCIVNGWLKTGDLGYVDNDGYLFIVDRKKALIIRGGENISCLEVENVLDKHPDIMESCVCGIDDDKFGEIVGAYIYTNKELTIEDLKIFMADKLANYKVPEVIIYTTKSLPRIASEKIDRVTIKRLLS
ncbi:MAG: class I adenylate-forming enzyme family protein [Gammaproteobacteria bacterium]